MQGCSVTNQIEPRDLNVCHDYKWLAGYLRRPANPIPANCSSSQQFRQERSIPRAIYTWDGEIALVHPRDAAPVSFRPACYWMAVLRGLSLLEDGGEKCACLIYNCGLLHCVHSSYKNASRNAMPATRELLDCRTRMSVTDDYMGQIC